MNRPSFPFKSEPNTNALASSTQKSTPTPQPTQVTVTSDRTPLEDALYKNLGAVRYELAQKENVKAFVVCHNDTLDLITRYRPTTNESFLKIKKIGSHFINKYADAFKSEIIKFSNETGLPSDLCAPFPPKSISSSSSPQSKHVTTLDPRSPLEDALFEKLRTLRLEFAHKENITAFQICHNDTLDIISRYRPTTNESFLKIKKIGSNFINKYADAFKSEIIKFSNENGLKVDQFAPPLPPSPSKLKDTAASPPPNVKSDTIANTASPSPKIKSESIVNATSPSPKIKSESIANAVTPLSSPSPSFSNISNAPENSRPTLASESSRSSLEEALFRNLRALRLEFARNANFGDDLYKVCRNDALDHMSRYRPTTNDSFLKIKGIGPNFVIKYAPSFKKEIIKFSNENGLQLDQCAPPPPPSPLKLKDTAKETYRLFQEGKSIAEIRDIRKYIPTSSTVEEHLQEAMAFGLPVEWERLGIADETYKAVADDYDANNSLRLGEIKQRIPSISWRDLKLCVGRLRQEKGLLPQAPSVETTEANKLKRKQEDLKELSPQKVARTRWDDYDESLGARVFTGGGAMDALNFMFPESSGW